MRGRIDEIKATIGIEKKTENSESKANNFGTEWGVVGVKYY